MQSTTNAVDQKIGHLNGIIMVMEGHHNDFLEHGKEHVRAILGQGWTVTRLGKNLDHLYVQPTEHISIADAWNAVHKLKSSDIKLVEPDFAIANQMNTLGFQIPSCDMPHKAGTNYKQWHLENIQAAEAWNLPTSGYPGSASRGRGIRIGHIDNGYFRHPEIWCDRLLWKEGYDFWEDRPEPWQTSDFFLDFPAHGTTTASILFSGYKNNMDPNDYILGVAHEAAIVPIRVDKSILVTAAKFIQSIDHAIFL